jgi:6-phosphogluconolactonase
MFWKNNDGSIGNPNKWFSIMEKEVMLKDKRATRSYGSFSPDRKFVLSNDLGNDKVYSYKYNQIQLAQY